MVLTLGISPVIAALLIALFLCVCVMMILIVLIQRPQGGGLSGAFGAGGGSGQTAFGAKTGDALTIATIGIFVLYLVLAVGLQFAARPSAAPAPAANVSTPSGTAGEGDSTSTPAGIPSTGEDAGQPTEQPGAGESPAGEQPPAEQPAPAAEDSNPPPAEGGSDTTSGDTGDGAGG